MGIYGELALNQFEKNGWFLIPSKNKIPIPGEWQTQPNSIDEQEELLNDYISSYGYADSSILNGKINKIKNLDIDIYEKEFVKELLPFLPKFNIARAGGKGFMAPVFYDGGGTERSFKYIKTIEVNGKPQVCRIGLEMLSDGTQSVLPPSDYPENDLTPEVKKYRWLTEKTLFDYRVDDIDLPKFDSKDFRLLCEKFYELAPKYGYSLEVVDNKSGTSGLGGRHGSLFLKMIDLLRDETNPEIVAEKLYLIDKETNQIPYFSDKKHFKRTYEKPISNSLAWVKRTIKSRAKKIEKKQEERRELMGKNFNDGQVIKDKYPSFATGFYKQVQTKDGGMITVPQYQEMGDYFRDELKVITSDSFIFIYEDEYYQRTEDGYIKSIINKLTMDQLKPAHLSGFYNIVMTKTHSKNLGIKDVRDLINLKNGILNVKTKKLIPHSSEYFFKYKLDHVYDPTSDCPKFKEFLEFIFDDKAEALKVTSEIYGYCLLGGRQFLEKCFILHGTGRNGKSTWLNILKNLLGSKNISSVSLANLEKPFSVVHLDGKLANITDETPNEKINAEIFKAATGSGDLVGAYKHKDEYIFPCNARFLFATNQMPKFGETTFALKERLYFLAFNKVIPKTQRHLSPFDYIISNEMPGIINLALAGIESLLSRGYLEETKANEEMMDEFKTDSDSVYHFFSEKLEIRESGDGFLSIDEVYKKYVDFTKDDGRFPVSKRVMVKRLEFEIKTHLNLSENEFKTRKRVSGEIKRGFSYLYFRSEYGAVN